MWIHRTLEDFKNQISDLVGFYIFYVSKYNDTSLRNKFQVLNYF